MPLTLHYSPATCQTISTTRAQPGFLNIFHTVTFIVSKRMVYLCVWTLFLCIFIRKLFVLLISDFENDFDVTYNGNELGKFILKSLFNNDWHFECLENSYSVIMPISASEIVIFYIWPHWLSQFYHDRFSSHITNTMKTPMVCLLLGRCILIHIMNITIKDINHGIITALQYIF